MAPKMEPTSAHKRLRAITEGVQKIVLKLGPNMCENGDPKGSQKYYKIVKIVEERFPKHRHVSRRFPKRSQGRLGAMLNRFWKAFGFKMEPQFVPNRAK